MIARKRKSLGVAAQRRSVFIGAMVAAIVPTCSYLAVADPSNEKNVKTLPETQKIVVRHYGQLIDSLANSNRPPDIEYFGGYGGAFFKENFDWKEQDRVVDAIKELVTRATPGLWEQLLGHASDERYCITFDDEWETSGNSARNWSVGRLCNEIAWFQLYYPVREATAVLNLNRDGRPVFLPLRKDADLSKVERNTLNQMSFADRQIGLCREAIDDLPKVNSQDGVNKVNLKTIKKCRVDLESMIGKIKESKTGIFGHFSFPGKRFQLYDVQRAERDRAAKSAAKAKAREAEREFYGRGASRSPADTPDGTTREEADEVRDWGQLRESLDKKIEEMKKERQKTK